MTVHNLRRIQAVLAIVAPVLVLLLSAWHSWSVDFARNAVLANFALVLLVCTLAFCLFKRSTGQETAWFGARISADPPGFEAEPVFLLSADVALVLATLFFLVLAGSRHAAG
jgi:hypothetical protein